MSDRRERRKVSGRGRAETHKTGFDSTSVKLPDGVKYFAVKKEGVARLEVIPYTVPEGANNPYAETGDLHFERTYWAHRGIGPEGGSYICSAKTASKKCPICEHRAQLAKDPDADEDLVKDLAPRERQLWNIFDHDNADDGVQVWDVSYHLFGKMLDARIKNADEDDGYEYFADPEDGMTLKVGFAEKSFAGNTFYETATIDFKKRSQELDADIIKKANVLDSLLVLKDYDELKKIYLQTDDDDEKPKKESERKEGARNKEESKKSEEPKKEKSVEKRPSTAIELGIERGDEVKHMKWGVCTILKITDDGTTLSLVDEKDEVHKGVELDEIKIKKAETKKEEPPQKKEEKPESKKETEKESKKDDDDGDWDTWDEKDED